MQCHSALRGGSSKYRAQAAAEDIQQYGVIDPLVMMIGRKVRREYREGVGPEHRVLRQSLYRGAH